MKRGPDTTTMARPTDTTDDGQILVPYLLGVLPGEETERLDEASIVDDQFAARLTDVENDLIDAYVTGALTGDTRKRFEAVYLASSRNRSRVESARRFRAAIDRASVGVVSRPTALVRPLLAAAATLVVAFGVLFHERLGVWWPLQRATPDRAEGVAGPPALATTLSPDVRAAGEVPTIVIAAGTRDVGVNLRLESNDFTRYQVALVDPRTGGALWQSDVLPPLAPGASLVSIDVPASVFSPQHYAFELSGVDATGRRKAIGSYAVQIERR